MHKFKHINVRLFPFVKNVLCIIIFYVNNNNSKTFKIKTEIFNLKGLIEKIDVLSAL